MKEYKHTHALNVQLLYVYIYIYANLYNVFILLYIQALTQAYNTFTAHMLASILCTEMHVSYTCVFI